MPANGPAANSAPKQKMRDCPAPKKLLHVCECVGTNDITYRK